MGRDGTPAREISFVSLVAYGHKVSDSALTMGVYSFWNQAGWGSQQPLLRLSADYPIETEQARREWQEIFQVMKSKGQQPRLLYPAGSHLKWKAKQVSQTKEG